MVTIAKDIFAIGEGGGISLGLMLGLGGVGTGVGPIVARRFTGDRDRPLRYAIILGYLMGAIGLAIVAPMLQFGWVLLGVTLRGIGGGIVWVFSTQLLLHLAPNPVRGRVFSTDFALFTLMSAIGSAVAGGALDASLSIPTIFLVDGGFDGDPSGSVGDMAGQRQTHRICPREMISKPTESAKRVVWNVLLVVSQTAEMCDSLLHITGAPA